jgi:hypothetical protein
MMVNNVVYSAQYELKNAYMLHPKRTKIVHLNTIMELRKPICIEMCGCSVHEFLNIFQKDD